MAYTYGVRGLGSTVYEEAQEYATGTAYTKTVTTKYDAAGNRTSQVYPSGLALTYSYNDINALSSVTDGTNTIASFSYIGFRPRVATFGNGATQTNTYGGFREDLTTVHHETSAPATLVRMDYGYNKVHDRTYERFGSSGSAGDAFEYDKARRLTKAWMGSSTPASPSGNTYVQTIAYNMDDDGNRSSVVVTPYGVSPTTTSYTTNNLNQYTAVGGTSQSYDANGNLTNNGTLTFKYNYKNLITEVRQSSGGTLVAEYLYDASGRRVVKNVNGGIFQRYIYADLETVSMLDGSQAWKQDFVFDVTGIDQILMLEQADVLDQDGDSNTAEITRSYYHCNAVGSVMEVSTSSQMEAVSRRYTPYGEETITRGGSAQSNDPLEQGWAFAARFVDRETGLHYLRSRYYSSKLGHFGGRDVAQHLAGSNPYLYAGAAPARFVDPMGLDGVPPRSAPSPGGTTSSTPGFLPHSETQEDPFRTENAEGEDRRVFSLWFYFWGPKGLDNSGRWIKSVVVATWTDTKVTPGTSVTPPEPKRTTEYWKMGKSRSLKADHHKDWWLASQDFCAAKVTIALTLQFGSLKRVDGKPLKKKSGADAEYVLESASYPVPADTFQVPAGELSFAETSLVSRWQYTIEWDYCPKNCNDKRWDNMKTPRWSEVTQPSDNPSPRPAATTTGD